ncbi:MAG: TetR/AcrR family transcriptional regulator [Candidatus Binataceae bacterium]
MSDKAATAVKVRKARRIGRPRKEDRPAGATRGQIMNAAADLFAIRGFDGTSMEAIAQRAGLTVGALYRHFSAKGELLLDVVRQALSSLPVAQHMRVDSGRADLLPEMVTLYTAPDLRRLRRLAIELHNAASRDRKVAKLLQEFNDRMAGDARARIEAGRRDGTLDDSYDADYAARFLMVLIMGLAHIDTLYPSMLADSGWRNYVMESVGMLLGVKPR